MIKDKRKTYRQALESAEPGDSSGTPCNLQQREYVDTGPYTLRAMSALPNVHKKCKMKMSWILSLHILVTFANRWKFQHESAFG
jgi:hypothetical protein